MTALRAYLLSIVSVCMLAAIVNAMVRGAVVTRVVKIVSGVLILLVVLRPLIGLDLTELSRRLQDVLGTSQASLADEKDLAHQRFQEQVAAATQTHIEEIAAKLGLSVSARVSVSDDEIPIPQSVTLYATVQPEQMLKLSDYIEEHIGIKKDQQHWRGYETTE